jgi:hypothetical protein
LKNKSTFFLKKHYYHLEYGRKHHLPSPKWIAASTSSTSIGVWNQLDGSANPDPQLIKLAHRRLNIELPIIQSTEASCYELIPQSTLASPSCSRR